MVTSVLTHPSFKNWEGMRTHWQLLATEWVIFRLFSVFFCTFQIPHEVHRLRCDQGE